MPRKILERIRDKIRSNDYDFSKHAHDEMNEDRLHTADAEQAILTGRIERAEKDDPRGTKYVILGVGADGVTPVGTVGRFDEAGYYLILTVYKLD